MVKQLKVKKLSILTCGILIFAAGNTFAAIPDGTVVIGDKAYELNYANTEANESEIQTAILTSNNKVYVKDYNGFWIDNTSNRMIEASIVPSVIYKDRTGKEQKYESGDGELVTDSQTSPSDGGQNGVPPVDEKPPENEKPTGNDIPSISNVTISGLPIFQSGLDLNVNLPNNPTYILQADVNMDCTLVITSIKLKVPDVTQELNLTSIINPQPKSISSGTTQINMLEKIPNDFMNIEYEYVRFTVQFKNNTDSSKLTTYSITVYK